MGKRKYVYFTEIERFGYIWQVISLTKEEAERAIKEKYIKIFTKENGYDPRDNDEDCGNGQTYWETFLDELIIEKRELNTVKWN